MRPAQTLIRAFVGGLALGLVWPALPAATAPREPADGCIAPPPHERAHSAGGVASMPLQVERDSRIVVMQYEAWFGPRALAFPRHVTPCLQSAGMQAAAIGGGYDSADPAVIARHLAWLQQMGVDAVTLDLSDSVSCTFDADASLLRKACGQPTEALTRSFHASRLAIRDNVANLYPAWAGLSTPLKLIPLLGGSDAFALRADPADRRGALHRQIRFFGDLMARYPQLSLVYQGLPLMLIRLGAPIEVGRAEAIRAMLKVSGLERRFTFRLIGRDLDSQPAFWAEPRSNPGGPIQIAARYGFWSLGDRLNNWGATPGPNFPTFSRCAGAVENMAASIASRGLYGWDCAGRPGALAYCPDAALRYCGRGAQNGCSASRYETFSEYMRLARELRPIFLFIQRFNGFQRSDEGWDANTDDDIEPTRQWGYGAIQAVIEQVEAYRRAGDPRRQERDDRDRTERRERRERDDRR
jgi:hypothetical protein